MKIDILYFEGCPNHSPVSQVVREVVREMGLEAFVNEVEVKSLEDATRLRFFGSPTIQVDGEDIDPSFRERTDFSFSCRVYGRTGTPPRDLIERAVRERMEG